MRHMLSIVALASLLLACGKDKPRDDDANAPPARSNLERPDSLPRPPGRGLPDDLRPPR